MCLLDPLYHLLVSVCVCKYIYSNQFIGTVNHICMSGWGKETIILTSFTGLTGSKENANQK